MLINGLMSMENYNTLKKSGSNSLSMNILALDTSSAACSVAFLRGQESRSRHEVLSLKHAQHILPFIEEILGPDRASLDALAWGCGPGSFTGLRIAASVIQALGFAYNLPVINVSSLAALAQTAYEEHGWKKLLVAVDARMNEIYWGAYEINEAGYAELCQEEGLVSPKELLSKLKTFSASKAWYGVGSAWSVYQAELGGCLKDGLQELDPHGLPKALAVAQLGRLKYEKGEGLQSFDALPRYLRDNICQNS
jgi:tRNA threonylcarbamoyladenosine biosynthesis protein TsaB